MIERGAPAPLGATAGADGVNFAVYSSMADAVDLCLFDGQGMQTAHYPLPDCEDGVWYGHLPGAGIGLGYAYRVHGEYAPSRGLRCNPRKVLLDPYARQLRGRFRWHPAVFDYAPGSDPAADEASPLDSAGYVPVGVVCPATPAPMPGPRIPWRETVIYELNVRGYTMRHPSLSATERGRFRGLSNGAILDYLRALGISSIELMPVHSFIDEEFLHCRGLCNYWGYNSVNFFTPAARYAGSDPGAEFLDMVNAIHDAGIEVILDVVYNHTAESDRLGPTFSFRGLDNREYYRLPADRPDDYINDTGCGNTINADSVVVQDLVLDSLRHWAGDMGIDGFRFDLAPALGRDPSGFDAHHPLLERLRTDSALANVKLIAEPWDVGPGGYCLGRFAAPWAEWNDRYRDSLRRWWRGDSDATPDFASRLHGSADLFEAGGRTATSSVNLVTSHDGYTLMDLVSYEQRHNEANGEQNRDGHRHNFSRNYGVEGTTDDATINATRRRQRLNMLATLFLSQGTPMLLAGDEFGNSQHGNNNAYAQDNAAGWVDWEGLAADPGFHAAVVQLIRLRRRHPLLPLPHYAHGLEAPLPGWADIEWLAPSGKTMRESDWADCDALTLLLADRAPDGSLLALALMLNRATQTRRLALPGQARDVQWRIAFRTGPAAMQDPVTNAWQLPSGSVLCVSAGC